MYQPLKYRDYVYPAWGQAIGWLITLSSLSLIPTVMIYKLINTTGSIQEVNISQYIHVRFILELRCNEGPGDSGEICPL